jgi:AraC family transcriptional regulator of arabinose operon
VKVVEKASNCICYGRPVHVPGIRSSLPAQYWHMEPELPLPWIVLPLEARKEALARPLSRHLLPSHVGFFPNAGRHNVRRENGATSTVFKYCMSGSGWCELAGRTFEVGPGDLFVLPESVPHAYGSSTVQPWTLHWIHGVGEDIGHVLRELEVDLQHPVVHLGKSLELVALFEELQRTMAADCSFEGLVYASQILAHLLGCMMRLRNQVGRQRPDARTRVLKTITAIQNHPHQTLTTEEAAALAGLSVSHFSALFRQLTRESPKHYTTRVKMLRARQLLLETVQSVRTISAGLGFADPLYFSRLFRAFHNRSPSEFRRGARSEICP